MARAIAMIDDPWEMVVVRICGGMVSPMSETLAMGRDGTECLIFPETPHKQCK